MTLHSGVDGRRVSCLHGKPGCRTRSLRLRQAALAQSPAPCRRRRRPQRALARQRLHGEIRALPGQTLHEIECEVTESCNTLHFRFQAARRMLSLSMRLPADGLTGGPEMRLSSTQRVVLLSQCALLGLLLIALSPSAEQSLAESAIQPVVDRFQMLGEKYSASRARYQELTYPELRDRLGPHPAWRE